MTTPPKGSLKALARAVAPVAPPASPEAQPEQDKPYAVAATRQNTRQISAHYAAADVIAFRALAAQMDRDVQELLAEGLNMVFERYGLPNRIEPKSGRRTAREA